MRRFAFRILMGSLLLVSFGWHAPSRAQDPPRGYSMSQPVNYGSSGVGTVAHLGLEYFTAQTGVREAFPDARLCYLSAAFPPCQR
ncbi:MAG: hypothetical protein HY322_05400 [Betaproteobacteria bacterium]|nr:hypothetical protein [Betaproteobacteria bacterium]